MNQKQRDAVAKIMDKAAHEAALAVPFGDFDMLIVEWKFVIKHKEQRGDALVLFGMPPKMTKALGGATKAAKKFKEALTDLVKGK